MFVKFLVFAFGLIIGSFLGALTYRIPRGESISSGRSKCPRCGKKINWFDNIPLLSYLLLGGKCRTCGKEISFRYPLVELGTALVFVFIATFKGLSLQGVYSYLPLLYLLFVSTILIAIFVIDLEHQVIPDEFVFLLYILALFAHLTTGNEEIFKYVLAGFSTSSFLLLLHLVTLGRGMGLGDAKLALFAGTFLGFPLSITWLYLSFLMGACVGVILLILGKAKFGQKIAFGPFLVLSFFVTVFWGDQITRILMPFLK